MRTNLGADFSLRTLYSVTYHLCCLVTCSVIPVTVSEHWRLPTGWN